MLSLPGLRGLSFSLVQSPSRCTYVVSRVVKIESTSLTWPGTFDKLQLALATVVAPSRWPFSKLLNRFSFFFFLSLSRAMCQTQAKQSIHLTSVVEIWMCAGTFSDTSLGEALWRWPQSGQRRHWTVGFWAVTIINLLYSFPSLKKWPKKFET